MSHWPDKIHITEVGPRDGLQNQSKLISTETKINLINALSQTGLTSIEASAFVHPKWVPQLADADEVFAGIEKNKKVKYSALVPNERGWNRALAAGVDEIAIFVAASEAFSEINTNTTIRGSIDRIRPIVEHATASDVGVRGYISCVIACPYEGKVDLQKVREITQELLDMGIKDIALGETLGIAVPSDICRLFDALDGVLSPEKSILHLHDTSGRGIACAAEAMHCGVLSFDASCGGLGGCPYAPGAAGNIATEDLVHFAHSNGIETGVDLVKLVAASGIIEKELDCPLRSATYRTFQDAQTRPSS
ncbi:MAG: hydroxymethylglutaryl-CoA lyase [Phycisphaerales bacterium]|jgi:hydroxymethylglutaryl-CoA lyase|nr:hydroxymethylglutaryl-CoA lyase [Phycisphaerales bacterium]